MQRLVSTIALFAGILALETACETLPAQITESAVVDQYLAQGRYRAACVGLQSKDPQIKTYTAQRLVAYGHDKDARACLCEGLYDTKRHKIDAVVGQGVDGSERDDLAECLQPALTDDGLTEEARTNAVRILAGIGSKVSYGTLVELMKSDPDAEIRSLAAGALRASRSSTADLVTAMQTDKAGPVRAAAAGSLDGHKGDEVQVALTKAALEDEDGATRGAALAVLAKGNRTTRLDEMLCKAMMDDPAPEVRVSAVKAYHGTKRVKAIECLEKRIMAEEESAEVRQATMDALKASPSDAVKPVLCAAVPGIVKRYITTEVPNTDNDASGTHIMKAQNDRDWEASFDCVTKALGHSGYSCAGTWYLTNWYNVLGGTRRLPTCPGLPTE